MGEQNDKIKYLDFNGLKKYDELIKKYIIEGNDILADAAASAVASVIDSAPESFDTLKEVAAWIADNDHSSDVSELLVDVAALKSINHDAYKSADTELEALLKKYIDDNMNTKQNLISDLEHIRSGSKLGATALQSIPEEYVTETELEGKGYLSETDLVFATDEEIDNLFN